MKITCEYCGTLYDDTLDKCPNCQAVNSNLNQAKEDNPVRTIEDLKKWYADRNLPPYETTRFFIGIDYRQPRAFGIYKDGDKFIVYKNKDNGQRAIRYEGTDEAFAVNELYMRLKEEIVNQKSLNTSSKGSRGIHFGRRDVNKLFNKCVPFAYLLFLGNIVAALFQSLSIRISESPLVFTIITIVTLLLVVIFVLGIAFAYVLFWIKTIGDLKEKHKFSDIVTSIIICMVMSGFALFGTVAAGVCAYFEIDNISNFKDYPKQGYYLGGSIKTDDETLWYRYKDNWYVYADGDWYEGSQPFLCSDESVKYDKFTMVPEDKFLGPDSTDRIIQMGYSDFFESAEYKDLSCEFVRGYYKYDDKVYYHLTESDSEWYYYDYDRTDWVNEFASDVPPELKHASVAQDFYYTPTWDSETQMTDFEDTEEYREQIEYEARKAEESSSSSSSSSDSSYDWSSSDSWDSGGTDWGSDW